MARTRAFDTDLVLRLTADLFCRKGFEGTSVDDLVTTTGVQRGSLYGAFGSKLGLFLAALDAGASPHPPAEHLDLLLVALLELAHRDERVRHSCARQLSHLPGSGTLLGDRLLARAGLETPVPQRVQPTATEPTPGGTS